MSLRFETNLVNVTASLLNRLQAPFSKNRLEKKLTEHPFYPSFYSLHHILNEMGVENEAFEVTAGQFGVFEPPYVAFFQPAGGVKDFVLVTQVTETIVRFQAGGKQEKQLPRSEFLTGFRNVILAAEAGAASGEKDLAAARAQDREVRNRKTALAIGALALLAVSLAVFLASVNAQWWLAAALSVTKLAGTGVCVLLLLYETDKTNKLVKNICTGMRQFNCDAVIGSRGARIMGLSWSEAGFFYFGTGLLFLLFPGLSFAVKLPLLQLAALLVSPYIVFSIYYQWRVVKQWCPLCLAVQAVLAAECLLALTALPLALVWPPLTVLAILCICLLLPVVGWLALKPVFNKAQRAPIYEAAYKRLLHHPDSVHTALQQQESAPEGWEKLGIVLGRSDAAHTILKVCNPYCGPCSAAHKVLEELLQLFPQVKLHILFTTTNQAGDRGLPVVRHLLALYEKGVEAETVNALDDWYLADTKDYERFAARYPMNGELVQQDEKIVAMGEWCKKAGIFYTPTIYVNGKRLPENYEVNILKHIF